MLTWSCERTPSPRRRPASGNSMVRREKVLRPGERISACLRGFLDLRVCR
jgi:hypothetical protein